MSWRTATRFSRLLLVDADPKKLERAIAEDLAWLTTHLTRRSNSEAMARSREFKVAMRQRIREVVASQNLSDEEIRPALKLKHETIGRFCQAHGVNIGWLLEGIGAVFKIWPAQGSAGADSGSATGGG